MRRKFPWFLSVAAIAATALYFTGHVHATLATTNPAFTSTSIAKGTFGEIEVFNHFIPPTTPGSHEKHDHNVWVSMQKTKGASDLYVQDNVWQPGADTGWHTHLGHSLIIVKAGTVTAYEGDDPDCKPTVYTVGMGFVDPGGGHVHILRNEGDVPAETIAVQLIPSKQPRRIDADDPGNCHFPVQ